MSSMHLTVHFIAVVETVSCIFKAIRLVHVCAVRDSCYEDEFNLVVLPSDSISVNIVPELHVFLS